MLDLVKAFELIPHHHIILAAIKHRYPLYLLRLSLAAYRLPRTVGIEGVYARTLVAWHAAALLLAQVSPLVSSEC